MLAKNSPLQICLMDVTGKILISELTTDSSAGFISKTIDVNNLQNGNYLLLIKTEGARARRKVVVNR